MKINNKNKLFLLSSFLISLIGFNTYSEATNKVSTYYLGSKAELTGFIDEELPPAIIANVALDSSIPAGTILYRQQHLNVTYYSPVPYPSIKGTQYENTNKAFREWGPWDMDENRVAYKEGSSYPLHFIPSSYKYDYVTLKKGATVSVPYLNTSGGDTTGTYGTISADTKVKVKSITNYSAGSGLCVYFDITGVPITRSSTYTPSVKIGRVVINSTNVGTKENYREIFKTVDSAYQNAYDNFSLYGQYKDTTDSSHETIEPGKWTNPSYADYGMAGVSGEWKCLGFNSKGEILYNPYYASKSLMFRGNAPLAEYDFRYTPWNPNDSMSGESEKNKQDAYNTFPERTVYDIDASGKYNADKRRLVEKLFTSGKLKRKKATLAEDVTDMLNRITFITHPSRESAVMMVQRRFGTATRRFMVENDINDIYLHSIIVKDTNGTQIGSYSYDINTGNSTMKEGWVKPGVNYKVEVYLGNANNNTLVSTKNHAQIGLVNNHVAVLSMPYGSTYKNQSNESSGRIASTKASKSPAIVFDITAPAESDNVDFFDVYGYVGYKHSGADNMNFSNDVGRVRLNINGTNYGEVTQHSYGDLVAKKIELIDSNGNTAYSFTRGESSPSINKVLPYTSYNVRFTIVNEKDNVESRTKSRGYWHSNGIDWIPGTWGAWTKKTSNISASFSCTRSGSTASSDTVNLLPREEFSTIGNGAVLNNGTISKNQQFTYTINNVFIEDPYFKCSFSLSSSLSQANSDTSNDSLSVTIKPTFDISVSNVRVSSNVEYVGDNSSTVSYVVTYDAKLTAPDYMNEKVNIAVDTSINIGGKTEIKRDILSVGDNKNLSHIISGATISSPGNITGTVKLNYNSFVYETNYSNNTGTGTTTIKDIENPFNTTVCAVPKTSNSWTSSQVENKWTATPGGYSTSDGAYRRYKKYSVSKSTVNPNHSESFNISEVLFRSKYTKDKKLGTNGDGWINLLNSSDAKNAYISAGYGFELKVTTKFVTNVNSVAKSNYIASNALSGTNYSYLTAKDNHNLIKELFIELPGNKDTRKIISTTGYAKTTKGLSVSTKTVVEDGKRIITNTYTLNSVNSLGISNSNKIFIPATLKDGDYKISIYTPLITGTPTASTDKQTVSKMCDRKEITIKVKGSYLDDLNSHSTSLN